MKSLNHFNTRGTHVNKEKLLIILAKVIAVVNSVFGRVPKNGKMTKRTENQRKNWGYPDHSTVKISWKTLKIPDNQRKNREHSDYSTVKISKNTCGREVSILFFRTNPLSLSRRTYFLSMLTFSNKSLKIFTLMNHFLHQLEILKNPEVLYRLTGNSKFTSK